MVFENVENDHGDSATGMAKRNQKGEPVVLLLNYKKSPKRLQQFIDFHEYAHHQTCDIVLTHPPRNSPDHMMNESVADCIATLRIKDERNGGKDVLLQALKQVL